MSDVVLRPALAADAEAMARIYNYYVVNTVVTFEEEPVSAQAIAERLAEIQQASLPWLIAEIDDAVIGYAYASKWKGRCAYRYSVETTVYLEHGREGRGIGPKLYAELLRMLQECGMHVAIGGVALPNEASVKLHEKLGFQRVATFLQVGFKQDRWIDVAYWQRVL
jgi:L-amino acid N-acyltransferase YncA